MLPVEPIVLSPFDAELFGHWWFEGPEFLDLFLRKAAYRPEGLSTDDSFELSVQSSHSADGQSLAIELGQQGLLGSLARSLQLVDLSTPARRGGEND